ncbi:hypothetical protein Aduo_019210 [Ancylostoma duodenale]
MRVTVFFVIVLVFVSAADAGLLIRMCGRRLSTIMEKMCTRPGETTPCFGGLSDYEEHALDGRVVGIAEKCCVGRCAYDQLNKYCCSEEDADNFYEMIRGSNERVQQEDSDEDTK